VAVVARKESQEKVLSGRSGGFQAAPDDPQKIVAGEPEEVRVHDFMDKELGKAIPYGVYDVTGNQGCVSVGVDLEHGDRRGSDHTGGTRPAKRPDGHQGERR
jgi:hypothetical protein